MDIYTTRPIKEISSNTFKDLLKGREITISPHALDHLSNNQRKLFKSEELIQMIQKDNPRKVYLQYNGRYATYYRKSKGFQKIIMELSKEAIVITFMNLSSLPKITVNDEN